MKISMTYSRGTKYGTGSDTSDFGVRIQDEPAFASKRTSLDIHFTFLQPVRGRGADWANRGHVDSACLSLSETEARRIAISLLWQLEQQSPKPLELGFGRAKPGQAEGRKDEEMIRDLLLKIRDK
jgi:hypothetical protein